MLKVLAACGNGMGSSTMIKIRIEQVLTELGLSYKVDHSSVGEAKGQAKNYDLILVAMPFVKDFQFVDSKTKVIGLVNLMSKPEIKEKVIQALGL